MSYYKIKDNEKVVFIRSCYDEKTIRDIFMNARRKWNEYKKREEKITDYKVRDFNVKDVTDNYGDLDIINIKEIQL